MICHDFFIIFLAFYVAFCTYRPSPIRVAETDPSRCRPSRRPRPRLWTMISTQQLTTMWIKLWLVCNHLNLPQLIRSLQLIIHVHMTIGFIELNDYCPIQLGNSNVRHAVLTTIIVHNTTVLGYLTFILNHWITW